MKKPSRHILTYALVGVAAAAALFVFYQVRSRRDALRISIPRKPTHMAVGQTSRLAAFEEFQKDDSPDVASAASRREVSRAPINAKWSVSDPQIASISEDGTLTALKPGRIEVRSEWQGFKSSTTVDVLKNLPTGVLPRIEVRGSRCLPQDVGVGLSEDGKLYLRLSYEGDECDDVAIEGAAPDQRLPWTFDGKGVRLEIKSATGPIVTGSVATPDGGEIVFTTWSDGSGAYPITLTGKTVLLTGDSMAEGLGWSMKEKVAAAGGRLVVIPWYSSTTFGWAKEGRLSQEIARHNPDLVFLALGSNEIFNTRADQGGPDIRKLVDELGGREAYWIGPPSWKPDRGIVRTIEENFIPDHFYNSNDLVVPRRKDGAHPTVEGYATWSDLIWKWYAKKF